MLTKAALGCCARRRKVLVSGVRSASRWGDMRALPMPAVQAVVKALGSGCRSESPLPWSRAPRTPAARCRPRVSQRLTVRDKGKLRLPRAVETYADPQRAGLPGGQFEVAGVRPAARTRSARTLSPRTPDCPGPAPGHPAAARRRRRSGRAVRQPRAARDRPSFPRPAPAHVRASTRPPACRAGSARSPRRRTRGERQQPRGHRGSAAARGAARTGLVHAIGDGGAIRFSL